MVRPLVRQAVCALLLVALAACTGNERDYSEAGIAELHDQMQRGELRSVELVDWYISQIDTIDRAGPTLNSIIEINPDAREIAKALDDEWRESGPRGPLHGIPVILKANIDTGDQMFTSAGSLALAKHRPAADAFVVMKLREAGAVILGKANLSEWANFRSAHSSSGWSSVGGQTLNPYDRRRSPCGSSSGSAVAVAANLTAVAIGTETDGSVVCPAGVNGVVGIKPTVGLVSRSGIIPISHSQDTAGPMGRTVRDAAILLTAMAGSDPNDDATQGAKTHHDYSANLAADALNDKRIGVIRSWYGAGSDDRVEDIYTSSIEAMKAAGATIVDDINIEPGEMFDAEYEVLLYEFRSDLNTYLKESGAPHDSLADLIEFNEANSATVMPVFGQDIFHAAEAKGPLTEQAYLTALKTSQRIARTAIDSLVEQHQLDALISPTNGAAWLIDHINGDSFGIGSSSLAAISGYPSVTVPAGFVSGMPIGLSFTALPWNEKQLIEIAYGFEQATGVRKPPEL